MLTILFTYLLLILGLYITGKSYRVGQKTVKCNSLKLQNANQLVLISGSLLLAGSLSYIIYQINCKVPDHSYKEYVYLSLSFVLGLVLTVCAGIIKSESKKENCDAEDNTILVIGIIILVLSISGVVYRVRMKN